MHGQSNNEACSCCQCCSAKAIRIAYSECVFVEIKYYTSVINTTFILHTTVYMSGRHVSNQQVILRPSKNTDPSVVHFLCIVGCHNAEKLNNVQICVLGGPENDLTYLLTPWCRVLLEQLTGLQLVKKSPHFTEPQGSLPHSQASATCLYSGPAQSSPHTHIPPPRDPS